MEKREGWEVGRGSQGGFGWAEGLFFSWKQTHITQKSVAVLLDFFPCSSYYCFSFWLKHTGREGGHCVTAWPQQAGQRSSTQFWGIFSFLFTGEIYIGQKKKEEEKKSTEKKSTEARAGVTIHKKKKKKNRQSLINPNGFVITDTYSGRQHIHWKQHGQ